MSAPEGSGADSTDPAGTSAVRPSDGDGTAVQPASFDVAPELLE